MGSETAPIELCRFSGRIDAHGALQTPNVTDPCGDRQVLDGRLGADAALASVRAFAAAGARSSITHAGHSPVRYGLSQQ
jgi:hypothetical protein